MVRASFFFAALAVASTALADQKCSLTQKCPSALPCCSQYGDCGVGAYCLGGCDPRSSFSLDSCVPAPVCQSKTYSFPDMSRIKSKSDYLGDSTEVDWVMDGEAAIHDNEVYLTMAEDTSGTLLASSVYMWYGNVQATFKTSRGQGVVTAFILLSDVKDEIDYEFVGADLGTAQSNYYYQGIPDYDNELNISLSDTFSNYHTYEIDWTPDAITWKVDGQVGRTKKRTETWNATSHQWMFPQTPARVQLSLWPAGLASNGKGTVDWAGGLVDWNAPDIKNNGYYFAAFQSVTISCYNASSAPGTNNGASYTYGSYAGTNDTVVNGNKPTVLKSLLGTGTDMNAGDPSASASGSHPAATAPTVPGISNTGPGADSHGDSGSSSAGAAAPSSSGSSTDSSGSGSGSGSSSSGSGFSQGSGSSGSSSSKSGAEKLGGQEKVLKGSVFAGIVAVVAMMAL